MFGVIGFVMAYKYPGTIPALGFFPHYEGELPGALRGRAPGRAVRGRLAQLGDGEPVGVVGEGGRAGKLRR